MCILRKVDLVSTILISIVMAHEANHILDFGVNASYESLLNSECSTCEVQDDKSAYWTPLLYYQYPNGSLINVPQSGAVVYYIGRGKNAKNAVPYPPGFRMISGDAAARAYDTNVRTYKNYRPVSDRVSWACLSRTPGRETYNITNTDCYAGLRAQLHFQTCWDGVNLYKSDQSHVAYMSEIDNGECPPTHPVQFVHIFLETSYMVNTIQREEGGRLVLSTGDTTGYSFHGDFQNGWNATTLTDAIRECASNESSGDINECEPLMRSYIRNAPQRCPMKPSTVDERVTGMLDKLPGCFNILSGPARAQPSDMNCPASIPRPSIIPMPDSTPLVFNLPTRGQQYGLANWQYTGCANDTQFGKRVLNGRMTSATNMTVETCQRYCASLNYKYAGLEISNECYCDNYLLNNPVFNEGNLYRGMCYWQCSGNKNQYCGGQARIDIYNNTGVPQLPQPSIQRASGTYGYKGCYIELNQARALANGSIANDNMTPDVCRKYCLGKKFKWFGVEYGREVSRFWRNLREITHTNKRPQCYCGDRLSPLSNRTDDSQCSSTCKGNAGQTQAFCGAASRLNVYYSATL
jgi:hypothetical protein